MSLSNPVKEALRSGVKIPAPYGTSPAAICQAWWAQHGQTTPVVIPAGEMVHVFMLDGQTHALDRTLVEECAGVAASADDQASLLYERFVQTFSRFMPEAECGVSVLKLGETVKLSRNVMICEFSTRNPTYYDAVFVFDDRTHIHYNKKDLTCSSPGALCAIHSGDIGGSVNGQEVLLHTIKFPSGEGRGLYAVCGYQSTPLHRFGPAITIIVDLDEQMSHLLVKANDVCDVGERTICFAPVQFDVHSDHVLCTPLADAQNTAGMSAVPSLANDDISRMVALLRNYTYVPLTRSLPSAASTSERELAGDSDASFVDYEGDFMVAHFGKPIELDLPLGKLCEKSLQIHIGTSMAAEPLSEEQTFMALPWLHGMFSGYQTFLLRARTPVVAPPRVKRGGEVWFMTDGAIPDAVRKLTVSQRRGVLLIVDTTKDEKHLGAVNLNGLAFCTLSAAAVARVRKGSHFQYFELVGTPLPEFGHPERFTLGKSCDAFIERLVDQHPWYPVPSPVDRPVGISPSGDLVSPDEVTCDAIVAAIPQAATDIGAKDFCIDYVACDPATCEAIQELAVEELPPRLLKAAACTSDQLENLRAALQCRFSEDKDAMGHLLEYLPSKARVATGALRHLCRCIACFAFSREAAQVQELRARLLEAIPKCFASQKAHLRKVKNQFCKLVAQHGYIGDTGGDCDEVAMEFKQVQEELAHAKAAVKAEKEFADIILDCLPGSISSGRLAAKGATAQRRQMTTMDHVERVKDACRNHEKAGELVDWLEEVSAYTLATSMKKSALEGLLRIVAGGKYDTMFQPGFADDRMCLDMLTEAIPALALVPTEQRQHSFGSSTEIQCAYYSTRGQTSCLVQHLPRMNVGLPSFLCSWAERSLKDFSAVPRILMRSQFIDCAMTRELSLSLDPSGVSSLVVAVPLMCIEGIAERRPDVGSTLEQAVRALLAAALEASAAGTVPWSTWAIDVFRSDGQRPNPQKSAPPCQRLFIIRALEVFVHYLSEPWGDVERALTQFRHALIRDFLYQLVEPVNAPKREAKQAAAKEMKSGYVRGRRAHTGCMVCADSGWKGEQPQHTLENYLPSRFEKHMSESQKLMMQTYFAAQAEDPQQVKDDSLASADVAIPIPENASSVVPLWQDGQENRQARVALRIAGQVGLSCEDVARALDIAQLTIDDLIAALKIMEENWEIMNTDVERLVLQQWPPLRDERGLAL